MTDTSPAPSPDQDSPKPSTVWSGVWDAVPIVTGYVPIAFSFGVVAVQSGFSPIEAILVSVLVFAGASQFMLVGMAASGMATTAVILAVVLSNIRHIFYGPSLLSGGVRHVTKRHAPLIAFGLTDEVFASVIGKKKRIGLPGWIPWLFGMELAAYLAWVAGTGIGGYAGKIDFPPVVDNAMSFVLPALFAALAFEIYQRDVKTTFVATGLLTLALALALPSSVALIAGMLLGAAFALKRRAS